MHGLVQSITGISIIATNSNPKAIEYYWPRECPIIAGVLSKSGEPNLKIVVTMILMIPSTNLLSCAPYAVVISGVLKNLTIMRASIHPNKNQRMSRPVITSENRSMYYPL